MRDKVDEIRVAQRLALADEIQRLRKELSIDSGINQIMRGQTERHNAKEAGDLADAVVVQLLEGLERPVVSIRVRDESARPELERLARRILDVL